jgi:hypothetical protein
VLRLGAVAFLRQGQVVEGCRQSPRHSVGHESGEYEAQARGEIEQEAVATFFVLRSRELGLQLTVVLDYFDGGARDLVHAGYESRLAPQRQVLPGAGERGCRLASASALGRCVETSGPSEIALDPVNRELIADATGAPMSNERRPSTSSVSTSRSSAVDAVDSSRDSSVAPSKREDAADSRTTLSAQRARSGPTTIAPATSSSARRLSDGLVEDGGLRGWFATLIYRPAGGELNATALCAAVMSSHGRTH